MYTQEQLRDELLTLDPSDFYYKHIVKSRNWYFSNYLQIPDNEIIDKMDFFKEIVSKNLNLSFHSAQIVGSAKTGYSLSPKKVLKPFHEKDDDEDSSDIDIAVISEGLFNELWNKLRNVKGIYYHQYHYSRITESIFGGFLNESDLIHFKDVRPFWEEKIAPVNQGLQDKLGFVHPITYRVYRSWDDLEAYQLSGIKKSKKELEEQRNV